MAHSIRSGRFRTINALVALAVTAGCVAYEADPIDLATIVASTPMLPPGELSFRDAVAFAFRHNPELVELAARARAAGADVAATELQSEWTGADDMLAVMIDPVALLRLGARGAVADLATARAAQAVAELAVARWRLVGRIAAIYAATTALAGIEQPGFTEDPEPFVRAGLAAPATAALARAALAGARAEQLALATDRAALRAELCTLLGAPESVALTLAPVAAAFPDLPPQDDEHLLQRPDLALALADYRTADAEFRAAVAAQYPSLMLGPDVPLRGGVVDAMAILRLPIGAGAPAEAAKERRAAARARVVAAVIDAANTAADAGRQHAAAAQRALAATASAQASAGALAAARAAVAVEVDAYEQLVDRAQMAVREAMERRAAVVAAGRARVQLAIAYGWPQARAPEVGP